jgi:hypothetical protein
MKKYNNKNTNTYLILIPAAVYLSATSQWCRDTKS